MRRASPSATPRFSERTAHPSVVGQFPIPSLASIETKRIGRSAMALNHAQSGEAISLLRADPFPELRSQALVSTPSLEVMRLVLKAGHVVPSHAVAGPITIHCLQGVIEVQVESRWQTLQD